MRYPFEGKYGVTQKFGVKDPIYSGGYHKGTDFGLPSGTPVLSIAQGTVVKTGEDSSAGKYIWIDSNGFRHKYFHLNTIFVQQGQGVAEGAKIGASGSTGLSTGPHLHLQVEVNGVPVDAQNFISNPSAYISQPANAGETPETHTIVSGDTYWDLERAYNIPHGTLQQLNPDKPARALRIGDTIKLKAATSGSTPENKRTHVIIGGDTFWGLETEYGLPHGTLQQRNPQYDARSLPIGATIRID